MRKRKLKARLLLGAVHLSAGLFVLGGRAVAADAAPPVLLAANTKTAEPATGVETVIVTGVRGAQPRTVADSPVPIDIISKAQIVDTGKVGLKAIFSSVIPSFNLPAQNGGGTSASVPPYSVRGLTADYVLVLVNGKRRHSTALINNLATVGGGSTPVDLDLIPPSAIDHIEVLRDGAAAQYGSDAIAGVINIILKDSAEGGEADLTAGQTYLGRGALGQAYANYGHSFFDGFINFSLAADHHEPAPANGPAGGLLYPLVGGAPDPREADANKDYGSAYGRSTRDNTIDLSYNLSTPVGAGLEAYSFSTLSFRDIKDARGAYRPDDPNAFPSIFPNGFQAYRLIHETDFQVAVGLKGSLAGWSWDASSTFGRDYNWLGASNTLNASLGPSVTQTSFFMGTQTFEQWTNNLDLTRGFAIGLAKSLDVSFGFEHRWEQFSQGAGEPNSYINGGYVVPNDGTPFGNLWHGYKETAGLQSFTGTTPSDASTHSRNNYAAYVDLGTNITDPWYVGLAGRAEHYDDSSGDTLSGKFTTRYEILPDLALRGAVNNGFRAPSLAEQDFSTTQNTSIVLNNVVTAAQVKFLPVNSPIAKLLGATPLTPERSVNYSVGLTYEPIQRLRFTVDAYQIDITGRIVKSTPVVGPAVQAALAALNFPQLSSAQFFTNAVNTTTKGIDFVAEYQQSLGEFGSVDWTAIYSGTATAITRINASAQNFNPTSQRQLTEQNPKDRIVFGADWSLSKWRVRLNETRYGRYEEPINPTTDARFSAKWITDLDVSYKLRPNLILAAGANNLLNTYPNRQPASILALENVDTTLKTAAGYTLANYGVPTSGGSLYGVDAPFGFGGFYYVRATVKF